MNTPDHPSNEHAVLGQKYAFATASLLLGIASFISLLGVEKGILAIVFGSIAFGMASGIWEEMAPTPLPGFGGKPKAEAESPAAWSAWTASLSEHRFPIVFGVIFVPTLWVRLARFRGKREEPNGPSRLQRIGTRLSKQWFGLIVGNAFGALISAIGLVWVQQFTFASVFLHWLLESVLAHFQGVARHLLGARTGDAIQAWFDWCGDNQLKFTFWFLYLAAICDDLGIPNLKTLGRWLGRRVRNLRKNRRRSLSGSPLD